MPNWDNLVREQMKSLDLPAHLKEEIFAELRAHLEDATADAPNHAMCHPTSQQEWHRLARAIQRAKQREDLMNNRVKRLWLVTAAVWLTATLSVMALQRPDQPLQYLLGFYLPWLAALPLACAAEAYFAQPADRVNNRTKLLWLSVTVTWLGAIASLVVLQWVDDSKLVVRRPIPVMFSLSWSATLLLVGAAGACLAQRADAPRKTRLLISTSPALLLGSAMLLLLPRYFANRYPWALIFFAADVESYVIVPGLALLLGALPFLRQRSGNSFSLPNSDGRASLPSTPLPE
jgi:hypothetical protein